MRHPDDIPPCPDKDSLIPIWKKCFDLVKSELSEGNIKSQGRFFTNVEFWITDYDQHFYFILDQDNGSIEFSWEKPAGEIDLRLELTAYAFHMISLERMAIIVALQKELMSIYKRTDFEFVRITRFFFLFKKVYKEYRLEMDYDIHIY